MKNFYNKFRNFNKKISLWIAIGLATDEEDAKIACESLPYLWLFMLIPISGFLGIAVVLQDIELQRRYTELERRKARFNQKRT